jgi:hypothetical protein
MNTLLTPLSWKSATAGLLLCGATLLAACTGDRAHEYLAHTDRVTPGSGDAVASNRAIHTIDPWSRQSHNTQIDMDGKRARQAARRYETAKPAAPPSDSGPLDVGQR